MKAIVLPLLEAIANYFGYGVTTFLHGPDPHDNGKVHSHWYIISLHFLVYSALICHSFHSNPEKGVAGCLWSEIPSFKFVQESIDQYAEKYWGGMSLLLTSFDSDT
jgi:hypothetical protein